MISALAAAQQWLDGTEINRELRSLCNRSASALTADSIPVQHSRPGAVMGRRIAFTKAQICRAVRAIEASGLKVKCVTIAADGAISISSEDTSPSAIPGKLASWDDAS